MRARARAGVRSPRVQQIGVCVCVHVYVAVRVYVSLYVFARSRLS